jgi:hypothetical protein
LPYNRPICRYDYFPSKSCTPFHQTLSIRVHPSRFRQ